MLRLTHAVLLGAGLAACGGDDPAPTDRPTDPTAATADTGEEATDVCDEGLATWELAAEPFLRTWCTPCHSSGLEGIDRQGAPAGLDFDQWELAAPVAALIGAAATPDDARMPPEGATSAEERAWLAQWIACGAPGPSRAPAACDALTVAPEGTTAPCTGGFNAIDGDLAVAPGTDLTCLCDVTGTLEATADVHAPLLQHIGGDLLIQGAAVTRVSAPALTAIDGALGVLDATALSTLDLPNLTTVGGDVRIARSLSGTHLDLQQLTDVGDDLIVDSLPTVTHLWLPRVKTVGGAYRVLDNPLLFDAPFFYALDTIGGDLILRNNPALTEVLLATYLSELGGSVEVGGNGIVQLALLHDAVSIGGDVFIHDEPALTTIVGMEDVLDVGGSLRLVNLPLLDSAILLPTVTQLGGLEVRGLALNPETPPGTLEQIDGDVTVADNPTLTLLPMVNGLTRIEGSLVLTDLPSLAGVGRLSSLEEVVGSIEVDNIGVIDLSLESLAFADSIEIRNLSQTTRIRMPALNTVYGSIAITDASAATTVVTIRDGINVQGGLRLNGLDALTSLTGLHPIGRLAGDLVVTDNAVLPPSEVDDLAAAIELLLGTVTNAGNGG